MKKITILSLLCSSSLTLMLPSWAADITMWTTDTQEGRLKTIQLITDTFGALNDHNVKVVPVDEAEYATQLIKAQSAGAMPDLLHYGSELAGNFGEEGILDIEANTAVVNELGESNFYQGALNIMKNSKGKYNAVPFYGWVQGLWYRADLFEQDGLEPPKTWDDILTAAKHFTDKDNGFYGIFMPSKMDQFADQVFTQIALSNGAAMFDKEGNVIFNSPEMVESLKFFKELSKYGPPGQQTWRARDYYLQNKMAMFFYSTFILDDIALAEAAENSLTASNFEDLKGAQFDEKLVEKTRMVPLIAASEENKPASYGQVTGFSVVKQDDKEAAQAAQDLIKFFQEEENLVAWSHTALGGANPAYKPVASSDAYLNDPVGLFERYGKDKITEIIGGMENVSKFSQVDGNVIAEANIVFAKMIIPQMIQKALWEGVSEEDAVAWAASQIQDIVDENRKK